MAMDMSGKGVKSEINVTPLVDVVLVLLIIFMVVTPLLKHGKPVDLPNAKHVSAFKSGVDPIVVSVTKDGKIWINQTEVSWGDLSKALVAALHAHPGAQVLIKGDRDVEYKTIRSLIAQISKTHLMGVSLAGTDTKKKG